jgi:hypothetical protein
MEKEAQQRHAEPAVHPVHHAEGVFREHASRAERKRRAGQPGASVSDVPSENELEEEGAEADGDQSPHLAFPRGTADQPGTAAFDRSSRGAPAEHNEPAKDQERVKQVRGADEIGKLQQHGSPAKEYLHPEQGEQASADSPHGWPGGPAHRRHDGGHQHCGGQDGHHAVSVLDQHIGAKWRDQPPVAQGPVRTGKARSRGAHDVAQGHEEKHRHHRRGRQRPARVSGLSE